MANKNLEKFVRMIQCENCLHFVFKKCQLTYCNYQESQSKKYDDGKLRYDLIPPEITEELAKVITYGSKKYGDNTWQGIETSRYYAALMRHLEAWRKGIDKDDESGLNHLSHALCNISYMLYQEMEKNK